MKTAIKLAERGWLPDIALRTGIRQMVSRRRRAMQRRAADSVAVGKQVFARQLADGPIAVQTAAANEQHYEVPAKFFEAVLGPRLKYSSCYYPNSQTTLAEAEEAMLAITCERADIVDGHDVLELGCGWGSLTLWMAERYPNSHITTVSNSASQRLFIESRAREMGLANVRIITADINAFVPPGAYDRIVSVEMFEHLRNWPLMFSRLGRWMRPEGRAFLHVFCHKDQPYLYEDKGQADWMARYFFSGGMMPSDDLPHHIAGPLQVEQQWQVNGTHYERTANDWLGNLDRQRTTLMLVLTDIYGTVEAHRWLHRWRMFFIGCAELFGHRQGEEWWVAHHRLQHRDLS
jgi:cyclopropane-fatty-acyl-phospholipid synthase